VFWHHDRQLHQNVASRHGQIRMKESVREALGLKPREADKMPTFSLHHLRHRFSLRYLKEGGSIYDLQQILGQESVKTTEVYLALLDPDTWSRVMHAPAGSAQKAP
jgi:site-specific recombinase XerD